MMMMMMIITMMSTIIIMIISFISMTIDAFITIYQPGHDVKIMQSNTAPRLKSSNLDSLATEQIIGITSIYLSIILCTHLYLSIYLSKRVRSNISIYRNNYVLIYGRCHHAPSLGMSEHRHWSRHL